MSVSQISRLAMAGAVVAIFGALQAFAEEPMNRNQQNPNHQMHQQGRSDMQTRTEATSADRGMSQSLPSKKIVGAAVQNKNNDKVGTIEDLVIDTNSGKVEYAALAVGGFLGMGEKLFAIPFEEFKIALDSSNNPYFVLDATKERLEKAPGFDKANWPDFSNPEWRQKNNDYYRHSSASRSGETENR